MTDVQNMMINHKWAFLKLECVSERERENT